MRTSPGAIGVLAALAIGWTVWSCGEGPTHSAPHTLATEDVPSVPTTEEFLGWALQGDVVRLEAAIAAGADLHSKTAEGATAVMLASFQGHTDAVHSLLQQGADVGQRDHSGRTALMYASSGAFAQTVELLLENGAEVNRVDAVEEWTALMFAGGEGLTEVIPVLLRHGADPDLKDVDGDTALTFAQRNGHEAAAVLLKGAMHE